MGFIGFFVSRLLLDKGWKVTGIDNLNPYYDIDLKKEKAADITRLQKL